MSRFTINRLCWGGLGMLTFAVAGVGLAIPSVYDGVINETIEPGVFAQDLVAALAAVVLMLMALVGRLRQTRRRVVALGLLGFLFYAYGIYAIEQIYTVLYPAYLALFGLSLFALIYGMATIPEPTRNALAVPRAVRITGAAYGILIAVLFNGLWLSQLIPLIERGQRIEYMHSIYVIDLSFIMPAFVISAVLTLRRHFVGLIGLPALCVLGVGILTPLALAELLKPVRYGLPTDWGGLGLYGTLSLLFMAFAAVFLATLTPRSRDDVAV